MKKRLFIYVICAVLTGSVGLPAAGAAEGGLASLIEEALENNQQIEAAREKLRAARYRVPQASALPDPVAGYSYMGEMVETRLGPQENMYEIEQEIPFPGKLIQKRKMARAEAELAEAQLKAAEREVTAKVSAAYYDLFAVQKTLEITERIYRLQQKAEAVIEANYASMKSSQVDAVSAQIATSETLERLFMLRQQRDSLTQYLGALLNRREFLPMEILGEPDLPAVDLSLEELLLKLDKTNPQILEAMAEARREEHAYSLAKYENAPDFSIGLQYIEIGSGMTSDPNDGRDAWMIPVKVTIPLWQNRIGAGIKEARHNLRASEAGLKDTKNLMAFELKNAYFEFISQKQTAELYRHAVVPQSEMVLRSDQAAYESGETGIIKMIESERMSLRSQAAYYQALAGALKSLSEIERLVDLKTHLNEVDSDEE